MLRIPNAFFVDFAKPYDVSIGYLGDYDQLAIIVGVGIITLIEVMSVVGVIIILKVSPMRIGTVPKAKARSLKLIQHDQFIFFGRRGVGFSFFLRVFVIGGRGFVIFIDGDDVILTLSNDLQRRALFPPYFTGSEPQ